MSNKIAELESHLRECRLALDELIKSKPALAGLLCGSTTLGNLKALLYEFRELPTPEAVSEKPIKAVKITEHSGCGNGVQVDMLTVRMKRGEVVVQMSESDFKRLNSGSKPFVVKLPEVADESNNPLVVAGWNAFRKAAIRAIKDAGGTVSDED